MSWPHPPRAPWGFTLLLVLAAVPAFFVFPEASVVLDSAQWIGSDYVSWIYPAYVVLMAVTAWKCYPERRTTAWVLFSVLMLTTIALFIPTLAKQ